MLNVRCFLVVCCVLLIGYDKITVIVSSLEGNIKVTSQLVRSRSSSEGTEDVKEKETCEAQNSCFDKLGYEAIATLHKQLDDDDNGNIDIAESDEFLRDELQYENGYDRQKGFHRNDKYISVDELWQSWITSEVHNWTMEETIEWLVSSVELPQYVKNFQENAIDGTTLPRMAISNMHFISSILGIKDPIHKQKLHLKAMDVVLFGPPRHHNYLKDVLLVFSMLIAIGGCWFAFVQHKYAQTHMHKMMFDMESLQNAEETLLELQKELDKAKMEHEYVVKEKQNLEQRLHEEKTLHEQLSLESSDSGVTFNDQSKIEKLELQLQSTKDELQRARKISESRSWVPPPALQHWLQMTYELELRHYNAKKAAAEQQLNAAKEGCEKLRKRRTSFLGSFRVAHGGSIDDVDNRILQAKAALSEVTKDLQERLHRWRQIELLSGFPIVVNPGLMQLESLLHISLATLHNYSPMKKSASNDDNESIIEEEPSFPSGIKTGSISNISTAAFRRSIFHPDMHNDLIAATGDRPILAEMELKHCSSSNAIMQLHNSVPNTEQLFSLGKKVRESDDERIEDNNITSSNQSPVDNVRPSFTIGDSPPEIYVKNEKMFEKKIKKSHSDDSGVKAPGMSLKLSYSESNLNASEKSNVTNIQDPTTQNWATKSSIAISSSARNSIMNSVVDEESSTDSGPSSLGSEGPKKKTKLFLPQLRKKKSKVS